MTTFSHPIIGTECILRKLATFKELVCNGYSSDLYNPNLASSTLNVTSNLLEPTYDVYMSLVTLKSHYFHSYTV
jgi:hypothetical protein